MGVSPCSHRCRLRPFGVLSVVWVMLLAACAGWQRPVPIATFQPPAASAAATLTPTPFLPATNTPIPPTVTPTPTPVHTPTPTATPTPTPLPRPQYRLDARLDYWKRTLDVEAHLHYPNTTGRTLETLVLNVEPAQWEGVFQLQNLEVNGQPAQSAWAGTRWEIALPQPLQPEQTLTLTVRYRLKLPYKTASRIFGASARQINLVDWYPFVVPYDPAEGWLWHKPWPFGDHLAYPAADFDVTLQVKDAPPETKIAASAWPADDGHYRLQAARTFAFSISPEFRTAQTTSQGITITSYYFPELAAGGKALPAYARKAVATFSKYYGPLPRQHLAIVATDAADGMEYSGLVFLSTNFYRQYDGTILNNLVSLGMHELSHQWWYDQVGNDQAMHPWLDEALATYSERLFYQDNYPKDAHLWWNFRVYWFHPEGYINRSIYDYATFRPYVNATYLRGAEFMEDLRQKIGDAAFFAFLQDYQNQMRGKIATPEDFFRILQAHTHAQRSDLQKGYFTPTP